VKFLKFFYVVTWWYYEVACRVISITIEAYAIYIADMVI